MGGLLRRAAASCLVACLASACGGGGGGGGSAGGAGRGSAQGTTAGGVTGPSATNQPQWQTAMAALAGAPAATRFEAPALAAWNDLLARSWPRLLALAAPEIDKALQTLARPSSASIQVLAVRNTRIDFGPAPGFSASAPAARQTVGLELPLASATWSIRFTADVGGFVPVTIFGITTQIQLSAPIEVAIADLAFRVPIEADLTRADDPRFTQAGQPSLAFRLGLSSTDTLAQSLIGPITSLLDPLIRNALLAVEWVARFQITDALLKMPQGTTWGLGGAPVQPAASAPALEPLAAAISDEIQRNHMPHDHVWPAVFDTTQPGTGSVLRYKDHGDSAFWTGHYLAAESFRFDLTGDPRALAGATRAMRGVDLLLSVSDPQDGLLARSAIPTADFWFKDIAQNGGLYLRTLHGVPHGAIGNVSRDQYLGVMLGMSQAWLRVPALRATIQPLVGRVLGYMERNGWVVYNADGVTISTTFATTPTPLYVFARLGEVVDPSRWSVLAQRYAPLASLSWFGAWVSGREVHVGYYKFNLSHAQLTMLLELETDPTLYRHHLQLLRIERGVIGHHQNAWFDAVYAMGVPTEAPTMGPIVEEELRLWTARPRRGFAARNSVDPTIQKATVVVTDSDFDTTTGQVQNVTRTIEVAVHPIPVDKRGPTDYLWQRSPFELDGSLDPRAQEPGIDLLLPYWMGRSHGFIP